MKRTDSLTPVLDRAVDEFDRARRDEAEAQRWGEAPADPAFRDEVARVAGIFDQADPFPD